MGITDVSQLNPELAAAAAPLTAPVAPASPAAIQPPAVPGNPVMPTGTAMAGLANPAAPDVTGPEAGLTGPASPSMLEKAAATPVSQMSFSQKMAAAADKLGIPHGPGGWAKSLVGAAQTALSGAEDALADAATAAKGAIPGEGALAAVGRIRAAQNARKQEEQKFQTEQQKQQADIAATNVQKMYHQTLLHQLSDEINEKDIKYGQTQVDSMTAHLTSLGLKPAQVVAKDVTEGQLQKAIKDNTWDPTTEVYYPTGSFEVPGQKDANGQPLLQKTYTILKVPEQQALTKDQVDRINKFVPGLKFDPENPPTMPGATAVSLLEQAHIGESLQDQRDHQLVEAGKDKLAKMDQAVQLAAREADGRLAKDPEYLKAQSQAKGNILGVYDYLKSKDPQAANDLVASYGGQKGFDAVVEKQNADLRKDAEDKEKARHDEKMEQLNAQKERDKQDKDNQYQGDENAATPEEFLKSLKPAEAATVKAIADGSLDVGRMAYLLARNPNLVAAVEKYDPNFDNSKVAGYAKQVLNFTSGEVGKSLTAGATAINHLRELYDLNTAASRIPGTSDYQKYQNKLDTVADELGAFYGNTTIPAIEGYKKTLDATFNRGAAIETQMNSMHDRLDNFKQQWYQAAPSDKYYGKMPDINAKAKADMQYVMNHGKVVQSAQPNAQPNQPAQPSGQAQPTSPAQPAGVLKHAVNDIVSQGGHNFRVTGVDANGKITGTEPVGAQ